YPVASVAPDSSPAPPDAQTPPQSPEYVQSRHTPQKENRPPALLTSAPDRSGFSDSGRWAARPGNDAQKPRPFQFAGAAHSCLYRFPAPGSDAGDRTPAYAVAAFA